MDSAMYTRRNFLSKAVLGSTGLTALSFLGCAAPTTVSTGGSSADKPQEFSWDASPPIYSPAIRPEDPCYSVKDPSIVSDDGRWHLFITIRSKVRSHQIEYASFADFREAESAQRHVLRIREGYFCAPQVFSFTPKKVWFLVHQVDEKDRKGGLASGCSRDNPFCRELRPAYATTHDLADPTSWSASRLLDVRVPAGARAIEDFWVICDAQRAHLFFFSFDGKMWRASTALENFPEGFGAPEVALRADFYEAGHIYRLSGGDRYLAIIEARTRDGTMYYKAYEAERLDGTWRPLADSEERAFAGKANVRWLASAGSPWADNFSHGELIRLGYDQTPTVDPVRLEFLFQGVTDRQRTGKTYGQIPWRLGILRPANP